MSINVEYNSKEVNQTVVENILKMLERRKLIKTWSDEFKKIDDFTKTTFEIIQTNKSMTSIYILNSKLTSIVQGTPLDDYLSNNIDISKIIIGKDVAKKVVKQIMSEYKNAEFFFETEMLEDIPSKVFIPEHQLLNKEEKEELLSKFADLDLARIFNTDVMARYYGSKVGDIFRIIRPSITAGKNIFYRRVVNGSIDILF